MLVAAHLTRVPFENLPNVYRFQNLGITGIPPLEFFLEGIEQLKPLGFAVCGNRLGGGWRLRIITGIMLIASRHAKAVHPRGHIREGFHHTSIDIPQADYARVKACCAARQTTMCKPSWFRRAASRRRPTTQNGRAFFDVQDEHLGVSLFLGFYS